MKLVKDIDKPSSNKSEVTDKQAEEAFKLQISGECGKVLLHPWE